MTSHVAPLLTVDDLDSLPDDGSRYELIEGEIFVSRAPGLTHQRVSRNILVAIDRYLEHSPIGEALATPGLVFGQLTAVIPDIVFYRNERRDEVISGERLVAAPDLIVEILSEGRENINRDRLAKRQLYGKYGVSEYWIVDPHKKSVEIYALSEETMERISKLAGDDRLESKAISGFACLVSEFFEF